MEKMHIFYGGPFSQWAHSPFVIDGITYGCAEQYMMAEKARLFVDLDALAEIMATDNPADQKAIGRRVKNFDVERWEKVARDVVYRANLAKFSQNTRFRKYLLATGDDTIVEASPTDRIWGIGLSEMDPRAYDRSQWQGRNWLGLEIMRVRAVLSGRAGQ